MTIESIRMNPKSLCQKLHDPTSKLPQSSRKLQKIFPIIVHQNQLQLYQGEK
jgi:hypothetical protein